MVTDGKLREFGWSRSSVFYPAAALAFWLLLAVAQFWSGNRAAGVILLLLSGKWVYDCIWYWTHPYVVFRKDSIRINRSPLNCQVIYWECIDQINESEGRQLEFLLYDDESITFSLMPLEFSQRHNFVIAVRSALGFAQSAHSDADRQLSINRSKARRLLEKAEELFRKGRFHRALPLLDEALRLNPEFDRCYLRRGLALFSCGCFEKSIADYNKAQELNPHLAESYYYKALAIEKTGRKEEALVSYRDFLRYASPGYSVLKDAVRERIRQLQEDGEA